MPADGHKAERTCLGCRKVLDQRKLVRYVATPEGVVLVDYRGKLPGRGAYTCLDRECILQAAKRQQFTRALRSKVEGPTGEDLIASLLIRIMDRVLSLVGMARKSGNVVSGSGLVLTALASQQSLGLVLVSQDVSSGIGEKVKNKADFLGVPWYSVSNKEDLGQLLGKGERSVVGIKPGRLAESIKEELSRYKHIAGEF